MMIATKATLRGGFCISRCPFKQATFRIKFRKRRFKNNSPRIHDDRIEDSYADSNAA